MMDLNEENLPVLCLTERALIRGRIRPRARAVEVEGGLAAELAAEAVPRPDPSFLALYNVTILDLERRVLKRLGELLLNLRHVVWVMEDDLAPQMDHIKTMLASEDTDGALSELERLIAVTAPDGELLYLAGIVYQAAGNEDRAFDSYSKALTLTQDEKVRSIIKRHIESRE